MKNDMNDFPNYIYDEVNLISYIVVTSNRENADKLVNYFKKKNINPTIRRKITDNYDFISGVKDYYKLLSKTDDNVIGTINNQILAKYEDNLKNK